jgi:hypothetical protein
MDPISCEDETDPEVLDRTSRAAETTLAAVHAGIGAIGNIIWHCAAHTKEPIEEHHLQSAAWLLQELATLADLAHEIESAAEYQQRKLEIAKARRGRS